MAGSRDSNDRPVSIHVPIVFIVLGLGVLFMCCKQFQEALRPWLMPGSRWTIEGKFEVWLPKDQGQEPMTRDAPVEEIRVALLWDEANRTTIRKFGTTTVRDDTELQVLIRDSYGGWVALGKPETPAIIDAAEQVPWQEVVRVVNLAKREKMENIEFAAGRDCQAMK